MTLTLSEMVQLEQLTELRKLVQKGTLWRGTSASVNAANVLSSGRDDLDQLLSGGWPSTAVTEIISAQSTGLSLLIPALARLSKQKRWLAWVNPPHVPYAPALSARGIDIRRILLLENLKREQTLWAGEQAIRSGNCAVVMLWPGKIAPAQVRRLQLAAEAGGCMAILFRPLRDASQASMAALRLQVDTSKEGLLLKVLKQRGRRAGGSLWIE